MSTSGANQLIRSSSTEDNEPLLSSTDRISSEEDTSKENKVQTLMASLSTWVRRFLRTKLGTLFILILCIGLGLFAVNFATSVMSHTKAVAASNEFDLSNAGRGLSSLNHHHPHARRKPTQNKGGAGGLVCRVPKLNLQSDTNKDAYHHMPPLQCLGEDLFFTHLGQLQINKTVLAGRKIKRCEYRSIEWLNDQSHAYSKAYVRRNEPFDFVVKHDFFRVQCYLGQKKATKKTENHVNDYQGRHLLQNKEEEEVDEGVIASQNLPNLVGSFGVPDFGTNLLKNQVQRVAPQEPVTPLTQRSTLKGTTHTPTEKIEENVESEEDEEEQRGEEEEEDLKNLENYHGESFDSAFESQSTPPNFDQFVAQIFTKEETRERLQEIKPSNNSLGMNVLIFALESMSHLSYQRKLPKTYAYLQEVLGSVTMKGYNIVGDSTTAALLPILTGKGETELPEARINQVGSQYVDAFNFIWNKFEQNGYVSLYAEDRPDVGTFQQHHNGFEEMPVDHYMRPFWLAATESDLHKKSPKFCLGAQPKHRYMLTYLRQYFMRYRMFPKFALTFLAELTQADNNPAEYIDKDLVDFLEFLRHQKALDNTMLVIMGDHGARHGQVRGTAQGKLEERLPFMSISLPQQFKDRHSKLWSNLRNNQHKLTTPFDLHETFRDILDVTRAQLPVRHNDRGISLFKEIPRNRTCESAGIDMHWCTCMRSSELDITDSIVQKAASVVVKQLNEMTKGEREKCEELRLQDIKDARVVIPNEQILHYQKNLKDVHHLGNFSQQHNLKQVHYQVIVETAPNDAQYEVTLLYSVVNRKHEITGSISRINKLGLQASCIGKSHPELLKYCFCREQPS